MCDMSLMSLEVPCITRGPKRFHLGVTRGPTSIQVMIFPHTTKGFTAVTEGPTPSACLGCTQGTNGKSKARVKALLLGQHKETPGGPPLCRAGVFSLTAVTNQDTMWLLLLPLLLLLCGFLSATAVVGGSAGFSRPP